MGLQKLRKKLILIGVVAARRRAKFEWFPMFLEVASAIRGSLTNAKLNMIQVARGKWLKKGPESPADEDAHTLAGKVNPFW